MPACLTRGRPAVTGRSLRAAGRGRRGAARPAAHRPWHGRDAGLHAGRHGGHGQGDDARDAAPERRRDRARQHLPPDAAARRGAHRAARRPASLHGLAGADPDRFRRLSGDVAGRAAHPRRGRRDLRLAPRRPPPSAHAGARGRDPGPARCDRDDGARRMHALPDRARRGGGLDAALDALGGALLARPIGRARAMACSASSRAASFPSCGPNPRAGWSRSASTAMRSAASRSASRRR